MLKLMFIACFLTLLSSKIVFAGNNYSAGALIFKVNCSQCHGALGLGDGYYPGLSSLGNTNLLDITKDTSKQHLNSVISTDLAHKNMREFKPLNASLSYELINFLSYYFREPTNAFISLNNTVVYKQPSLLVGESTYRRRCTICHGIKGDGKGRLAKVIRNPSPYDLTTSFISDGLIRQVINEGGVIQGRHSSDTMPAFGNEISNFELESLMLYIKAFRKEL